MSTTTEVPHLPGTPSATCPDGMTPDYRFFCRPISSTSNADTAISCATGWYATNNGFPYCEASKTSAAPAPTLSTITTAPTPTSALTSGGSSGWPGSGPSTSGFVATSVLSGSGSGVVTRSTGTGGGTVVVTPTGTAASTGLGVRHADLDAGTSALVGLVLGALMLLRLVV